MHTVYLEDGAVRHKILAVIDAVNDLFASEIMYHRSCWKKYIRPLCDSEECDDSRLHLQNVRFVEVHHMIFQHIRSSVLQMHEPRTLQGLLQDYNNLMRNYSFDVLSIKTSRIKQLLKEQFGNKLGFHDRYHKNQSTIVYDTTARGSYIEAAINFWVVSDEQLINSVARCLKEKLSKEDIMKWPPAEQELENHEEPHIFLRQFLTWLRNPAQKLVYTM